MTRQWSQRFQDEFAVRLPPDVVDWLDERLYEQQDNSGLRLFDQAIDPERILDASSATVWGGQMLPDTLPILDNGCGDVLALRFGADDGLKEVIRWNHEGSGWRPYGATLAEAVLADVATTRSEEDAGGNPDYFGYRFDEWAARWVRERCAPSLTWPDVFDNDGLSLIRALLEAGVCEPLARRTLCKSCLTSGLERRNREMGGANLARHLGVQWPELWAWLLDTALVPDRFRKKLSRLVDLPQDEMLRQDWDGAAEHARHVRRLRPDLSWPHGVVGYAAERAGAYRQAIQDYAAGAEALGSSDDILEGHGGHGTDAYKFVVHRLRALRARPEFATLENPYVHNVLDAEHSRDAHERVRGYWLARAAEAESQRDYGRAYGCYYSAGWDGYVYDDIETVLEGLVRAAEEAGYTALHRIARHHVASLRA